MNFTDQAIHLINLGLCIIPVSMPSKQPTIKEWGPYIKRLPSPGELSYNGAIALICGKVSGNVEAFDIDVKHDATLTTRMKEVFGSFIDEIWSQVLVQKTASGGYHFIYRCETIEGNQKLAKRPHEDPKKQPECLLETRGEGGFVVIHPTPGYTLVRGSFDNIPTITPETRDRLLTLARSMDEVVKEPIVYKKKQLSVDGTRPGDDYNEKTSIPEIIEPLGWKPVRNNSRYIYYRRPDAHTTGHDATFDKELNLFRCFSTSTVLSTELNYTPFNLYAALHHSGDHAAAAKELYEKGFGKRSELPQHTNGTQPPDTPQIITRIKKLEIWLSEHYDFRRNSITAHIMCRPKGTQEWQFCNENEIWRQLQNDIHSLGKGKRGGEVSIPITELCTILDSDFVQEYNPFIDYFNSLEPWDGIDHISDLANHITTDDQQFWLQQFKKSLVRSIACTLDRVVNRIVMVLVSEEQEIGKSLFIRFICPDKLKMYYKEDPLVHEKDSEIALAENFIWNLEELDDLTKKEISALKAIISREWVKQRRAYARYEKPMPRIVNFWGSTNKSDFLLEDKNTRWMCFNVLAVSHDYKNINTGISTINIDKVWSQAYHLYKSGFQHNLSAEERLRRDVRNKMFETMSDEQQLILRYFTPASKDNPSATFMANIDIREFLNLNTSNKTRLDERNIGRALKSLSFKQDIKKINNKTVKGYYVIKNINPQAFDEDLKHQQFLFESSPDHNGFE